jgi:predicted transcriptional regulator
LREDHYAYVLIENEKWWNRRLKQNTTGNGVHAFVRRGRVGPKEAQKILFYVMHPMKQIKGFEFLERITGTSDKLWNTYGSETVFESKDEYDLFVKGRRNVTFIRFKNMEEFDNSIGLDIVYTAKGIRKIPQGGMYLSPETLNLIVKGELKTI